MGGMFLLIKSAAFCPGACDRGYFRGEGREAGEVAGESVWEIFLPRLALTGVCAGFAWPVRPRDAGPGADH